MEGVCSLILWWYLCFGIIIIDWWVSPWNPSTPLQYSHADSYATPVYYVVVIIYTKSVWSQVGWLWVLSWPYPYSDSKHVQLNSYSNVKVLADNTVTFTSSRYKIITIAFSRSSQYELTWNNCYNMSHTEDTVIGIGYRIVMYNMQLTTKSQCKQKCCVECFNKLFWWCRRWLLRKTWGQIEVRYWLTLYKLSVLACITDNLLSLCINVCAHCALP